MERKNSTDMKNLCNTIREMAERPVETDMKKAFHGTLTEMARQVTDPEQLDELSKKTLGSYIKKASDDLTGKKAISAAAAQYRNTGAVSPRILNKVSKKIKNRNKGIARATDELMKEDSEQLDEVKKRNEWGMSQADAKRARKRTLARQAKAAKSYVPSEAAKKESDAVYRRVTGKPPINEGEYGPDADWKGDGATKEAMKRLAAKALKRARKKAKGSSTDDKYAGSKPKAGKTDPDMKNARHAGAIAEMAAPGMEKWASDPKVKASFKKQYGKRWKEVMYAKSWKMSKEKGLAESEQLNEYQAKRLRIFRRNKPLSPETADFMKRSFLRKISRDERISGGKGSVKALDIRTRKKAAAMKAKGLAESEQLDEAGYKRLMRLRKAAYKAGVQGVRRVDPQSSHGRKMRAAAEREAQVAAGMARRGGASQEAVKGGGSRIGKSGKYTQKAGALANQRDKALAKFRSRAGYNKAQGMSRSSTEKQISRNTQQFQDDLRNRSRSGDFGQDNQAALRARSNYEKTFGRLKGK